jgi:hypothetical protein
LRRLVLKNNSFVFTNLLHKELNKPLLRKYCKERASVVTHFEVPHKQKIRKKYKIKKIQKKIKKMFEENKKIYISEKGIPEYPRSCRRVVEEDQIYKIEKI